MPCSLNHPFELRGTDPSEVETPDLASYDHIIIATSFGKDSVACHLRLLDLGIDKIPGAMDRIEWWHHDVDDDDPFMDWPITREYGKALARHFDIPLYFSAREGGFRREMLKKNVQSGGYWFEGPHGRTYVPSQSKPNTRMQYPQVTADLRQRWCSPYLKIMVASTAITNQSRFCNARTLFITGERAEESASRARYNPFQPHRNDARAGRLKRHIDHWMPVHHLPETTIWRLFKRYSLLAAPPYYLGFSRFSCAGCIFGQADHFATIREIHPVLFRELVEYDRIFNKTMKRGISLEDLAARGKPFTAAIENPELCKRALQTAWNGPVTTNDWKLPAGAYKASGGPV